MADVDLCLTHRFTNIDENNVYICCWKIMLEYRLGINLQSTTYLTTLCVCVY